MWFESIVLRSSFSPPNILSVQGKIFLFTAGGVYKFDHVTSKFYHVGVIPGFNGAGCGAILKKYKIIIIEQSTIKLS